LSTHVEVGAPAQALRATYPQAVLIDAPHSEAQWLEALAQTQTLLSDGYLLGSGHEGRAILGACLCSNDGARVRIDVLTAGLYGLRLFKVRHATVGTDTDLDTVAMWVHVAARFGLRVQSAGLLLINTDFVYPGHGCYAGLFREVDLSPMLGSRPVGDWLVAMRACERQPQADAVKTNCSTHASCTFSRLCDIQEPHSKFTHAAHLDVVGKELAQALQAEVHLDLLSVPPSRMPDARRLRELAALFEDLATDLEVLLSRVVDLFPIARAHYYHPAMCGSWSFKSICRAIAPDLQADQFEWQSETAAQVAFARGQLEPGDAASRQALRLALTAHGQRQTAALRRMVALFAQALTPSPAYPTPP